MPVSTLNPMEGIEVAVTHRGLGMSDDKASYNEENIIDLYESLESYTINSAELLGLKKYVGSIEEGKLADLIILDKNIFKIDPWMIHSAKVIWVMINGEVILNLLN
jgi:predicted amidohydrolase YtcJ